MKSNVHITLQYEQIHADALSRRLCHNSSFLFVPCRPFLLHWHQATQSSIENQNSQAQKNSERERERQINSLTPFAACCFYFEYCVQSAGEESICLTHKSMHIYERANNKFVIKFICITIQDGD